MRPRLVAARLAVGLVVVRAGSWAGWHPAPAGIHRSHARPTVFGSRAHARSASGRAIPDPSQRPRGRHTHLHTATHQTVPEHCGSDCACGLCAICVCGFAYTQKRYNCEARTQHRHHRASSPWHSLTVHDHRALHGATYYLGVGRGGSQNGARRPTRPRDRARISHGDHHSLRSPRGTGGQALTESLESWRYPDLKIVGPVNEAYFKVPLASGLLVFCMPHISGARPQANERSMGCAARFALVRAVRSTDLGGERYSHTDVLRAFCRQGDGDSH